MAECAFRLDYSDYLDDNQIMNNAAQHTRQRARIYLERNRSSWGIEVNRQTVAAGFFSAEEAARVARTMGLLVWNDLVLHDDADARTYASFDRQGRPCTMTVPE